MKNRVFLIPYFLRFLNESLKNENLETFNFGVKDGVRGFFTDPSRADDSFVPFSSFDKLRIIQTNYAYETSENRMNTYSSTITAEKDYQTCFVFVSSSIGNNANVKASISSLELTSNGEAEITLLEDSGSMEAYNSYRTGASRVQTYKVSNLLNSEILTATMVNSKTYGAYFVTMQILSD